jgi:hypothetical protein
MDEEDRMSETNEIDEGGTAFPQHGWSSNPEVLERMKNQGGMSLRDWFAGQETLGDFDHPEEKMPANGAIALAGPQPDKDAGWEAHFVWNAKWRAKLRYMRADAMIAARRTE